MKYLKWFLISTFVFAGILYSGWKGGWIEDQEFNNMEAKYADISDSLKVGSGTTMKKCWVSNDTLFFIMGSDTFYNVNKK